MPPQRRDQPASSAAAPMVFQDKTTSLAGVMPGSILELPALMVTLALKLSVPKKAPRMVRPAALKVLCPDTYSGNGGVTTLSAWYGCQFWPRTCPKPLPGPSQEVTCWFLYRSRMAVIGRAKSFLASYLHAQAEMLASSRALPSAKNSLTSRSRLLLRMRDRAWANVAMCPGGSSVWGPSAQYSALTFWASVRLEVSRRAVSMSVGS